MSNYEKNNEKSQCTDSGRSRLYSVNVKTKKIN